MLLLSPLIFMSSSMDAWGGRFNTDPALTGSRDASLGPHFPMNSDQGWFVEESYLLMKPYLGDLDYGNMVFATFSGSTTDYKIKVKTPEFEWNSGVRVGIGRYLPHHDKWDVSFYTTYIYGNTKDRAHGNFDQAKALVSINPPVTSTGSNRTSAVWRLNYFTLDLTIGRLFSMTPDIIFRPYLGLRGALIYDDFKVRNEGVVSITSPNMVPFVGPGNSKSFSMQDFWGIGPRIGTNFDYKFTGNWSFLGNLATSLLYGRYHVKEKQSASISNDPLAIPTSSKSFDHDNTLRANLEGGIGIGWEKWFQQNTIRIAPSLVYEGILWFDMNDFFTPERILSQLHGNLGFTGISFNLQVDF